MLDAVFCFWSALVRTTLISHEERTSVIRSDVLRCVGKVVIWVTHLTDDVLSPGSDSDRILIRGRHIRDSAIDGVHQDHIDAGYDLSGMLSMASSGPSQSPALTRSGRLHP